MAGPVRSKLDLPIGQMPVTSMNVLTDTTTLSPTRVGELCRQAIADMGNGIAYGSKVVLQPSDEELLPLLGTPVAALCLGEQRLNWKLNALLSANARYCGVKIVGSNAVNRAFDRPRSQSLLLLYDKLTMTLLAHFDGTALSALRTGAYASIAVDVLLQDKSELSVSLHGAGPIADCVIDDLEAHHAARIRTVEVHSRRPERAAAFAARARARTGLDVRASGDRSLPADLVITATNTAQPVVAPEMLEGDVAVLHLGGDELPAAFIERALAVGTVICDDVAGVCQRSSQSLPLYFSRHGQRMSELATLFRIRSLHEPDALDAASRRPALMTCVGLPVLDLCLAQWLHEQQAGAVQPPLVTMEED